MSDDVRLLLYILAPTAIVLLFTAGILFQSSRFVRNLQARNRAYLSSAMVSKSLLPVDSLVEASFRPRAGDSHSIWLDLSLASRGTLGFHIFLSVQLGHTASFDGTYAVESDSEGSLGGLPDGEISFHHSSSLGGPDGNRLEMIKRALCFDVPASFTGATIRARVTPMPGVEIRRMNLLVIPGAPPL